MGNRLRPRLVQADLFTGDGKWKYHVELDYNFHGFDYEDWDLWGNARTALAVATQRGTSGVTLELIPEGWWLVVLEPYGLNSHPIMVRR